MQTPARPLHPHHGLPGGDKGSSLRDPKALEQFLQEALRIALERQARLEREIVFAEDRLAFASEQHRHLTQAAEPVNLATSADASAAVSGSSRPAGDTSRQKAAKTESIIKLEEQIASKERVCQRLQKDCEVLIENLEEKRRACGENLKAARARELEALLEGPSFRSFSTISTAASCSSTSYEDQPIHSGPLRTETDWLNSLRSVPQESPRGGSPETPRQKQSFLDSALLPAGSTQRYLQQHEGQQQQLGRAQDTRSSANGLLQEKLQLDKPSPQRDVPARRNSATEKGIADATKQKAHHKTGSAAQEVDLKAFSACQRAAILRRRAEEQRNGSNGKVDGRDAVSSWPLKKRPTNEQCSVLAAPAVRKTDRRKSLPTARLPPQTASSPKKAATDDAARTAEGENCVVQ
eukprot:TRINITY_DN39758_c0_g1_i1.p1 TRINITY_DN39758_c0_g1~~TRINITY_DN39758_c0_g1_i1.p1  ORF type:complete len:408 (+),score=86.63 TRINITY_DN39758_c0_g1_i1:124-1347(+)